MSAVQIRAKRKRVQNDRLQQSGPSLPFLQVLGRKEKNEKPLVKTAFINAIWGKRSRKTPTNLYKSIKTN